VKTQATATHGSHYCTCLGHLGQHDTDRIISISLIWPRRVRKAISHHVNTALVSYLLWSINDTDALI